VKEGIPWPEGGPFEQGEQEEPYAPPEVRRIMVPGRWIFYWDYTLAEHADFSEAQAAKGKYRPMSLSMYLRDGKPRYTAVWVRQPHNPEHRKMLHHVSAAELQAFDQSYRPTFGATILCGVGAGSTGRFCAVYERGVDSRIHLDLLDRELDRTTFIYATYGYNRFMRWLSAYGTVDEHLFAAVFTAQRYGLNHGGERHGRINWGWGRDNVIRADGTGHDEIFNAHLQGFARPDLIVLGPGRDEKGQRRCAACIWRDDVLPDPFYVRDESVRKFPQIVHDQHEQHGRFPMRVTAYADRFAAIFARDDLTVPYVSDRPVKRVWSVDRTKTEAQMAYSPSSVDKLAPFDDYMKALMQHYNIRGGQLAIAYKGRLVLAHAYTWAEPNWFGGQEGDAYPKITLNHTFRIGSVSKALNATMALLAGEMSPDYPNVDAFLNEKISVAANLQNKNDGEPVANEHLREDVKVWHLLSHVGRIVDNHPKVLQSSWDLKNPTGEEGMRPVNEDDLGTYYASADDAVDSPPSLVKPAPESDARYSGVGSILASLAIKRALGVQSYGVAVQQMLKDRLGISDNSTRLFAENFMEGQKYNEAPCHPAIPGIGRNPGTQSNAVHENDKDDLYIVGPLVPTAYSADAISIAAAGGWVMRAVDLVKVLAGMSADASFKLYQYQSTLDALVTIACEPRGLPGWDRPEDTYPAYDPYYLKQFKLLNRRMYVMAHNGAIVGGNALAFRRYTKPDETYSSDKEVAVVLLLNYDIPPGEDSFGVQQAEGALHMAIHGKVLNDLINDVEAAGGWPFDDLFGDVKEDT
jgi:CubicO group peptidase (beta-lactamase class C family)